MTSQQFCLQMMNRSQMLLTVADDDPAACFLVDDPRRNPQPSTVEVARTIFDDLVKSGMVEPVELDLGGEWYAVKAGVDTNFEGRVDVD